jgi:hypothetical protein
MVNEGGFPALGAHFTLQPSSTPQERQPATRKDGSSINLAFVRRFGDHAIGIVDRPLPFCRSRIIERDQVRVRKASGSQPEPFQQWRSASVAISPFLGSSQKNGQQKHGKQTGIALAVVTLRLQ